MKITDVKVFTIHPGWRKNLLFVKVETDDGISGWGEAYTQYDRDRAVKSHLDEMSRYLVGRDPFQIRHFRRILFDDFAQRRGSLEFYSAFSGIEIALWDIAGKATGQPIYNLLGGPCRKKNSCLCQWLGLQITKYRRLCTRSRKCGGARLYRHEI